MSRRKKRSKNKRQHRRYSRLLNGITGQQMIGFVLLLISLGLIAYWRIQLIDIPFDRDEGTYYILGEMISNGATPYAEAYEMKPPGLLYLYALIWMVFGGSIAGLHWGLFVFSMASMILLFLWSRQLMDDISGALATFAFGLFSLTPRMSGYAGVSEHFVLFFSIAGFLFLFYAMKKSNFWYYLISGIFMAGAVSIKQNGLFFAGLGLITPVLYHGIKYGKWWNRSIGRALVAYTAGGISLGVLFTLILLLNGAFDDFWYWNYTYAGEIYTSAIPIEQGWEYFKSYFKVLSRFNTYLWIGSAVGLITVWFHSRRWFKATFLSLFALTSFAAIVPGLRFYGHYWLFLAPAVGLLFGSLIHILPLLVQTLVSTQISRLILILGTGILTTLHVYQHTNYYINPSEPVILRQTYGNNPFFEIHKVGEWLRPKIPGHSKLAVFGSEAQLYVQMGIKPPSEHVFMSFLAKNHDKKQQLIEEFKQDIRETNPHIAVFVNHPYSWSITARDDQSIYQWCYNYFQDNYKVVGLVEIFPSSPSNFDFTGRSEARSDYYIWVGLRNDLRNEQSQQQQLEITPNNKQLKVTPN